MIASWIDDFFNLVAISHSVKTCVPWRHVVNNTLWDVDGSACLMACDQYIVNCFKFPINKSGFDLWCSPCRNLFNHNTCSYRRSNIEIRTSTGKDISAPSGNNLTENIFRFGKRLLAFSLQIHPCIHHDVPIGPKVFNNAEDIRITRGSAMEYVTRDIKKSFRVLDNNIDLVH